jgi:predicted kinase
MTPKPFVAMAGAPGAGKTTFVRRHFAPGNVFSLDTIRFWLTGDAANQAATPAAVSILNRIVAQRCAHNQLTVVDATNATPWIRDDLLRSVHRYHRPALLIVVHATLEQCLRRQDYRRQPTDEAPHGRAVPSIAVRNIHQQIQDSLPTIRLGFRSALHVLPDGRQYLHGPVAPFAADMPWLRSTPHIEPDQLPALLEGALR